MARPHKEKRLLMTAPLTIMLTPEHKSLIEQAAKLDFSDVSSWIRPILIQAAQSRIAREDLKKASKK
jgi:uncharacterized protein (DUF1778 family)